MKDAARSYRLLGAPSAAGERASVPSPEAEDRLLRSGVDEIHQAVEFALILLCRLSNNQWATPPAPTDPRNS